MILVVSGNPSVRISDFVTEKILECKKPNECHNKQFFHSDITQISPSWFVFATSIDIKGPSPNPGWQGAMFYKVK